MISDSKNLFHPHMPEVDIRPDIEEIFSRTRAAAAESSQDKDGLYRRQVIIVTPGRLLIAKECPLPAEIPPQELNRTIQLLPPSPPRNIAVITYTFMEALKKDLLKTIPFFGYLIGFATIGHNVWAFEGHSSALAEGCREADILLVDSGILPYLEPDEKWKEIALSTMRGSEIKLIQREKD